MIKAEIIGSEQVVAMLGSIYPKVIDITKKSITASLFELSAYVKASKLSGQVLRNRSGRLRRSIHTTDVEDKGGTIEGAVGTNVEYAAAHEYGFSGSVTVKAHMRMCKQAFGRALKNPRSISVGAHGRTVNLPEKSFLRSALKELAPQFITRLKEDVAKGLKT